jgi:hypothetical protein
MQPDFCYIARLSTLARKRDRRQIGANGSRRFQAVPQRAGGFEWDFANIAAATLEVAGMKTDSTYPPAGLFTKSASAIARACLEESLAERTVVGNADAELFH